MCGMTDTTGDPTAHRPPERVFQSQNMGKRMTSRMLVETHGLGVRVAVIRLDLVAEADRTYVSTITLRSLMCV